MKGCFLRALFEAQTHEEGNPNPAPTTPVSGNEESILIDPEDMTVSPQRTSTRRDSMMLTSATTMNTTIASLSAGQSQWSLRQVIDEDLHGKAVSLLMLDEFYEGGWGIKWHLAAWEHIATKQGIYSHVSSIFQDLTGKNVRSLQTFVKDHIKFFKPMHLAYCMLSSTCFPNMDQLPLLSTLKCVHRYNYSEIVQATQIPLS